MTKLKAVIVRDMEGEEVQRIEVNNPTSHKVETVVRGLLRNMDTDRFYVDDSEFDGMFYWAP